MRRLPAGLMMAAAVISAGCSDIDQVSAGPGCRDRARSLAPIGEVRGSGRGDFDGDRRTDTVTVYEAAGRAHDATATPALGFPYRIRVGFAAGGTTDEELPERGTVGSVVDVNGDDRDEIVIDLGGNTGLSVEFATVVACRVMVAEGPDGLPGAFGYYGHSTGYPGSVGTHCLDSNGDGRLDQVVQVASEPVGYPDVNGDGLHTTMDYALAGSDAVDHYSWERQSYTLEDGRFRLLSDTAGRYPEREGQLELSNDLLCEQPVGG